MHPGLGLVLSLENFPGRPLSGSNGLFYSYAIEIELGQSQPNIVSKPTRRKERHKLK